MKKLLCLLVVTVLIVGCSSNTSPKEDKSENKKVTENSKTDVTKKDGDKQKKDEDVSDGKKEDSSNSQESDPKESSSSTKNSDKKESNNNGNSSDGGNSNGNSSNGNNGGTTTPPKQEQTPPPKEETPPPAPATPSEQRGKADGIMAQINAYRQQNGLAPFVITNYLLTKSSNHAYAMAEARALWHSGAAECITNYDDPFSAWVNSPNHNALLLSNNETGAVSIYYVDGYYYSVFQTLP